MIRLVIENLKPRQNHRFIFICQQAHIARYQLRRFLSEWSGDCIVIPLEGLTEGAACTVLAAKAHIDNDEPLMIANSDQYVDTDIDAYIEALQEGDLDGLIMTMKADHPKWSYVRMSDRGHVTEVVEKVVVSDEATVGIYNFRRGADFVRAAESMIVEDRRVNGEFYVAPTYNALIEAGRRVGIHNIGAEGAGMYGLGVPDDLNRFLALDISRRAVGARI